MRSPKSLMRSTHFVKRSMVFDGEIVGKTVRLRSVTEADAGVTLAMRTDPEKSRYIHSVSGSLKDQTSFIRSQMSKDGDYLFLVEDLAGQPIGMKGVYDFDPITNSVETGRFISFGNQVQSIEALLLSFDFAFDFMGVDSIRMSVLSENSNMRGIQERFGVVVTGVEPSDEFQCDTIYSVLTREAYAQTRPKIMFLIERFACRS